MTRTREQDRKPSRAAGSTAITLVLLAVTAGFLWSSLSVGQTASWIPQWVLAATSLVLLLQLAADIRDHFSRPDDQSLPGAADGQSAWPALLWLGLMLLALWLLGVSSGRGAILRRLYALVRAGILAGQCCLRDCSGTGCATAVWRTAAKLALYRRRHQPAISHPPPTRLVRPGGARHWQAVPVQRPARAMKCRATATTGRHTRRWPRAGRAWGPSLRT